MIIPFFAFSNSVTVKESGAVGKIAVLGDSITAFADEQQGAVSAIVDNGDGTATVTLASHNFAVGHPIRVNVAPQSKFNVFDGVVTAVSTSPTRVTYTLGGRTSPVTSATIGDCQVMAPLRRSCIGWAAWLDYYLGRPTNVVSVAAGGADSGQVLSMFAEAQPQIAGATDVVICVGMNDIYARGWDFATTQASIKALIDTVASKSYRLHVLGIPPRNSAISGWTSAKQIVHTRINRWLYDYVQSIGGYSIDAWRAQQNGLTYVNPAATNPDPNTNFTNAGDGTHPLNVGAKALAKAVAASVGKNVEPAFIASHSAAQSQGNALTNPSFTGSSGTKTPGTGTITGTAPDSWTVEITSGTIGLTLTSPARTVVADGDASGNNLQVAVSGQGVFRLMQSGIQAAVVAGEKRRLRFPVKATSLAGLTGVEVVIFGTKSSGGNENVGFVGSSQAISGDETGLYVSPEWTVPSGLTGLTVFLRFYFGSGGAGTIIIGKPEFVSQ